MQFGGSADAPVLSAKKQDSEKYIKEVRGDVCDADALTLNHLFLTVLINLFFYIEQFASYIICVALILIINSEICMSHSILWYRMLVPKHLYE